MPRTEQTGSQEGEDSSENHLGITKYFYPKMIDDKTAASGSQRDETGTGALKKTVKGGQVLLIDSSLSGL